MVNKQRLTFLEQQHCIVLFPEIGPIQQTLWCRDCCFLMDVVLNMSLIL